MLRHQLGQDLVFGLDLLLQIGDPFLFGGRVRPSLRLEGGRAVLKELFLPTVENRWLQPKLPRTGPKSVSFPVDAVAEWSPSVRLSGVGVLFSCVLSVILTGNAPLRFQLRRNRTWSSALAHIERPG